MSPTKQMKQYEYSEYRNQPIFENKARKIMATLKKMDDDKLRAVIKGSDKIFNQAKNLITQFTFDDNLTPAIFSYDGIAFKYLAPEVLDDDSLAFLQSHLFILSALYGAVRCFDGIGLYRLEMGSCLMIDNQNLYTFHQAVNEVIKDEVIINLASKEYSKVITNPMIDISFYCLESGKLKTKATTSKMARGSMVRYIAENKIEDLEQLKQFDQLGFKYDESLSTKKNLVFVKKG